MDLREMELKLEKEKLEVEKLKWRSVALGKDLQAAFNPSAFQ